MRWGILVGDLRKRLTYGDYLDYKLALELELNQPSRADLYAAQIATEVRRSVAKTPSRIKIKDMILKMDLPAEKKHETVEEYSQRAKAIWKSRLVGLKPRKQQ